jgi:putative hemolysin
VSPLWGAVALSLSALAFFSACEAALTSISRIRLQHWVGKRLGGAQAEELLERPASLLGMVFVGANLSIVCLAVSAATLLGRGAALADRWPVVAAIAVTVLATPPAVLLGDVLPRAVVHEHPARLLPALFAASRVLSFLFWPYIALVNATAWILFRALGVPPRLEERSFSASSVDTLLREGEREGIVDQHEREIIGGIFDFGQTPVREVMTPRPDVVSIQLGSSRETTARRIWETGFSRFPVTDGSPENIVGMVHVLDVLKAREGQRLRVRPVLFIPETMTCDEVLYAMRRQRIQLAVVLDEYGGMAGIVTLEDLVEELVGEIRDEHDDREMSAISARERGLLVSARARLGEVARRVPVELGEDEIDETVAAYVLRRLGRVPARGERLALGSLEMEVAQATPKRLLRVWIREPGAAGTVADVDSVEPRAGT